ESPGARAGCGEENPPRRNRRARSESEEGRTDCNGELRGDAPGHRGPGEHRPHRHHGAARHGRRADRGSRPTPRKYTPTRAWLSTRRRVLDCFLISETDPPGRMYPHRGRVSLNDRFPMPTRLIRSRMSRRPAARLHVEPLEAREVPASLAGRVFLDFDNSGAANGPDSGLWGVTVTLSGGGLTTPLTQTTDAQGNFSFTGLAAGTYTLTETQPTAPANQSGKTTAGTAGGSTTTLNTVSGIVLAASTAATGYTFAEVPLVSTGGFVYQDTNGNGKKDAGEPGIAGVTVTLTGSAAGSDTAITPKTAVTGDDGSYTFTGLVPGKYTLTETQPNGFIDGKEENGTPTGATVSDDKFTSIDLTKSSAASGGFNFGEVKAGSISGVVFNDANNDGTKAATREPGNTGVKCRVARAGARAH